MKFEGVFSWYSGKLLAWPLQSGEALRDGFASMTRPSTGVSADFAAGFSCAAPAAPLRLASPRPKSAPAAPLIWSWLITSVPRWSEMTGGRVSFTTTVRLFWLSFPTIGPVGHSRLSLRSWTWYVMTYMPATDEMATCAGVLTFFCSVRRRRLTASEVHV